MACGFLMGRGVLFLGVVLRFFQGSIQSGCTSADKGAIFAFLTSQIMDKLHSQRQVIALSMGLMALLVAVYLLSYSGVYHSGDEIFYFEQATDLAMGESQTIQQGGPYVVVLAAIFALTKDLEHMGPLQAMFLTNVVTTAIAALFLFLLVIELGYGKSIAILVALLYGLTTPAWVYSKNLFREPWAAAGLVGAMFFLVRFRHHALIRDILFSIVSLAIAVAARTSVATFAPLAVLYAFLAAREHTTDRQDLRVDRRQVGIFALAILSGLVLVALALAANMRFLVGAVQEFDPLNRLIIPFVGLLVSPGRGLFLFAPVMLLALAGLPRYSRDHRWETIVVVGSFVPYLIIVSLHPKWWGGWNWGPRFLVPFLPLLILPTSAVLHTIVVERRRRWLAIVAVLLSLIGILVQILGVVFYTGAPTFSGIFSTADAFMMSVSPFDWMASAWTSIPIDLAWWNLGGTWKDSASVVVPGLLLAMAGGFVLVSALRSAPPTRKLTITVIGLFAMIVAVAVWSLTQYYALDRRYLEGSGYGTAIAQVLDRQREGDVLVVDYWSSEDSHIVPSRMSNFCRGSCPPYETVAREPWPTREDKAEWLDNLVESYDRIWLIPIGVSSGDPSSVVEAFFDQKTYKAGCEWTGSAMRLCRYVTGSDPDFVTSSDSPDALFGDNIALRHVDLEWPGDSSKFEAGKVSAKAGEPFLIGLTWEALGPIENRYKVSLQVLDQLNNVVQQIDREPRDSFLPTSSWQSGQIIIDRYALEMSQELLPGSYRTILAVYDPTTGQRLPVWDRAGYASGNEVLLAELEIQ